MFWFIKMYQDLEKELKEKKKYEYIPSLDILMNSIEQEGFIESAKDSPKFLYELYDIILNDYARRDLHS